MLQVSALETSTEIQEASSPSLQRILLWFKLDHKIGIQILMWLLNHPFWTSKSKVTASRIQGSIGQPSSTSCSTSMACNELKETCRFLKFDSKTNFKMYSFQGIKNHSNWTSFCPSKALQSSEGQKRHYIPTHTRFCASRFLDIFLVYEEFHQLILMYKTFPFQ